MNICITCEKTFTPTQHSAGKYCSRSCYAVIGQIEHSCLQCGLSFQAYKSSRRKFCSPPCSTKHLVASPQFALKKGAFSGSKHWNWKGGITARNFLLRRKFARENKATILKRDGFKCVLCKSSKNLQVDHIKSWAQNKDLRFDIANCQTLCNKCHYQKTFNRPMPDSVKNWGFPTKFQPC